MKSIIKKLVPSIIVVLLVGLSVAVGAYAATAAVTATVTVKYAAISLNRTSFAYGSMNSNTASSTLQLWAGAGIVATNDGSAASFDIYGANTTGTTGWTLGANTTGNTYMHQFCNSTDSVCTTPPTNYTALTTSPGTLKASVANAGTVAFQLRLTTPTTPTDFSQQSAAVTVQATAN